MGNRARPPEPPQWAAHTVDESGRIVHERLASLHPRASVDYIDGARPTDVSVSVTDVPAGNGWSRQDPTVQVEGGSYALADAWQLFEALREVLSAVGSTRSAVQHQSHHPASIRREWI